MKLWKGIAKGLQPQIEEWDSPTLREFEGKMVQGRPTKGYGESNFNYAGRLYNPEPWTEEASTLKSFLENMILEEYNRKINFTFCLCGLYKDGEVSIPHHSDTVPTQQDIVLGVSYGAPRLLEWRQYNLSIKKKTNTSKTHLDSVYLRSKTKRYLLEDGDVYVFNGRSQMKSTHSIPTLEGVGQRISLTFRSGI
tara:strand:+ start:262 stop:843 length:582 start_codon:yes stop_codon:yes gene_type:complete